MKKTNNYPDEMIFIKENFHFLTNKKLLQEMNSRRMGLRKSIQIRLASQENKEFWKITPSGRLELHIDHQDSMYVFQDLGGFYVTIEKTERE